MGREFPYSAAMTSHRSVILPVLLICATSLQGAPTLVKLRDFNNTNYTSTPNPQNVNDSPILIGNTLWFTCEKGGNNLVGALSKYDIETGVISVVLSMDNVTGQTPKSSPVPDGDLLYITTIGSTSGSIYSTLFSYDRVANTYTPKLWEAASGSNPSARSPWGGVTVIDRGTFGKDLYFTTYNGGAGNTGTIQRYQTATNTTHEVYVFPNSPGGKFPYKGFTAVGTDLYFTTFNGGTGLGTLGKLDVSVRGAETVTALAAMPTAAEPSSQLPSHNPYYRAADNSLYFTTVGSNTQPGALMKFDISSNQLSFVHKVQGGPTSGNYPEGNKCYGPVAEWNKALYYTTIGGGANVATGTGVGGTINRYDLRTGTHEVLFSLDAGTGDNFGGECRGGGVFNGSTTAPAFYFITKQGGLHDHGTILRMDLDPVIPPSSFETWLAQYPSLTGASATLGADPDQDGLNNRTEFAFGTDPTSGAGGAGHDASCHDGQLEIRWTARTDGTVAYAVTTSDTLGSQQAPWTSVSATPETMPVPDVVLPGGYERRRVMLPITGPRAFFRVEATLSPSAIP